MAYIGREPQIGNFQVCDAISVVNGQAAYTMQVSSVNVSPETANHMIVSLNGIIQAPGSSYTVSGSTITFASNLVTGDVINFIHILGSVLDLGVPSDNTVSLAKLTATGTKDATTFLRGDNTFAAAGGLNLISTTNVTSGVSQVDITSGIDSTYKNYQIHVINLHPANDDVKLLIRFFSASGILTGNSYTYGQYGHRQDGTALSSNDGGTDRAQLTINGVGNANNEQVSSIINLYNFSETTYLKLFNANTISLNASAHACATTTGGKYADTIALTGVRLYMESGNIDAAIIKLYGIS